MPPFVVVLSGVSDVILGGCQQSNRLSWNVLANVPMVASFVNLPVGQLIQLAWPVVL